MKASKRFEKMMLKRGIKVITGRAVQWLASRQHAENWNQGPAGRRIAFAQFSEGYRAWIEPTKSYASWAEATRENQ